MDLNTLELLKECLAYLQYERDIRLVLDPDLGDLIKKIDDHMNKYLWTHNDLSDSFVKGLRKSEIK